MIAPVLLFAFNSIVLAFAIVFQDPEIMGGLATEGTFGLIFGQLLRPVVGLFLTIWNYYLL
ncbi:hypothetical protein GCM10025857_55880 [Alicyclobacillus contaminans]|nr:hypothetical protein GCM10025857_55880 [Alicyclobacillus contaminans]